MFNMIKMTRTEMEILNTPTVNHGTRAGKTILIQNKLPKNLVQKTIADLKNEESAYTVPWAVTINSSGLGYIDESFGAGEFQGGTVCMLVTKVLGGYTVDLLDEEYRFDSFKDDHGPPDKGVPVRFVGRLASDEEEPNPS